MSQERFIESESSAKRWGTLLFFTAVVAGAFLRLYDLDLKPLHSDEGVNGHFLLRLVEKGFYRYNPQNYHGPILYYLSYIPVFIQKWIFGAKATVGALRIATSFFGIGSILILWPLRHVIGWTCLVFVSWVLAIHPAMVYFSRTAIHEIYMVFFALASVVCLVRYGLQCREVTTGADSSLGVNKLIKKGTGTVWLIAGVSCLALLYATKETAVITYGAFSVGLFSAFFFCKGAGALLFQDLTIHTFNIGHLEDEKLHVRTWRLPELIPERFEERDPYELPECIIAKKGILNEQKLQAQNHRTTL